jgi:hypothetical protein
VEEGDTVRLPDRDGVTVGVLDADGEGDRVDEGVSESLLVVVVDRVVVAERVALDVVLNVDVRDCVVLLDGVCELDMEVLADTEGVDVGVRDTDDVNVVDADGLRLTVVEVVREPVRLADEV